MSAKIITFANQKGGTGKTTLCMQLAGTLARHGSTTLVIDADPQGTATRWAGSADQNTPFPASVIGHAMDHGPVHTRVKEHSGSYSHILIDCPPAIESPVLMSALLVSDLCVVPVIPSPADLWSTIGIRELIYRMHGANSRLQTRLVANMCQPQTRVAREILDIMRDFGIPLMNTRIHLRTAYRQSALFGTTVSALNGAALMAIDEINALTREVTELLRPVT